MQQPRKLYGIDHLRALAIVLVFLFHYEMRIFGHPAWVADVGRFGWTGVDLFFVLSGFLISSQLFAQIVIGEKISYPVFFLKRFFRIIPAFLVVVAIYFWCPFFHEREALLPLWRYLTFTQNIGLNIAKYGTFSHAWSLCAEEHFYLVLPVSLILLQGTVVMKKAWWLILFLFAGGLVLRHYCYTTIYEPAMTDENGGALWYTYIYYPTYSRLDGFLAGISVAAVCNFLPRLWQKVSRFGNYMVLLGTGLLTGAYFLCYNQLTYSASVFGFPLISLGYALLVAGAVSPSCFLYKWKSASTAFVASIAYAAYLTHKGVIHSVQVLLGTSLAMDSNLMLIVCIACCVVAALALRLAIERPFMLLRKRVFQEKESR